MMKNLFIDYFWTGPLISGLLRLSDYYFTLSCAKLYKDQRVIKYEGSFELTPMFQADVDSFRRMSPQFIRILILTTVLICLIWFLCNYSGNWEIYLISLGAMILMGLVVHMRHLYNWFTFRYGILTGEIQGHIEYPREYILSSSSFDFFLFAGLFLIVFAITYDWFFLGGCFACGVTAYKHYRLAVKHRNSKASAS
jgi:hypothetical protein